MPNIVIPYKPRALQKILHGQIDKHRFSVVVLHRRAGKTVMCINHMLRAALTNKLLNPRYAFISPYRLQGKAQHGITLNSSQEKFLALNLMNLSLDVIWQMVQGLQFLVQKTIKQLEVLV